MKKLIVIGAILAAYGSLWAGAQENDLIRLAQSGVDAQVLSSYVSVARGPFHLTVDQIIELNQLGVPSSVITAALQHAGTVAAAPAVPANTLYPMAPDASYPMASNGQYSGQADVAPAAPDTVVVQSPPEVVAYPDPYYDYWDYGPYVGLGWGWGPGFGWGIGAGYYGRGFGHAAPVGIRGGGQFGRGIFRGSNSGRGGSYGGGRSSGSYSGGGHGGGYSGGGHSGGGHAGGGGGGHGGGHR